MEDAASISSISTIEEIIIPEDVGPVNAGFIPAFMHRDFLTEAECILFESMGVTVFCKNWIVFYRLVLQNDILFGLVR